MFRARTVFVIGAGASAEFGFPVGSKLLTEIATSVDIRYDFGRIESGDYMVAEALRSHPSIKGDNTEYNLHLHSAWQLVKSSAQGLSIDNVIDALEDPRASLIGKIGIVSNILKAENNNAMSGWADWRPEGIKIEIFAKTWLAQLVKIITENIRKSQVGDIFNNISIINFNYDRTVEQFLPFAIAQYYGVELDEVRQAMRSLKSFRPYGKVGNLPWEGGEQVFPFGDCSARAFASASKNILTFTEQIQDDELVAGIHHAVSTADRIVFLGFGFHRQNVSILSAKAQSHLQVIATSFGLSKSDAAVVCSELEKAFQLDQVSTLKKHDFVSLYPLLCNDFMSEVWRTLTSEAGEDPTWEMPNTMPGFQMPRIPGLSR